MIIDAHCHVHPVPGGLGGRRDASPDAFLEAFEASPADVAVLLPIEPHMPTEMALETAQRLPNRLACMASVDLRRGDQALEDVEELAASGAFCGLKLHPRRQGVTRDDWPLLARLTGVAAGHDLATLVDSFPYGKGGIHDDTLELVEYLAEETPEARLVIAHMGGIRILEALILARTSYRIYLDLSLILSVYQGSHIEPDIFYAIRRIGADRCVYGSDFPDVGLRDSYELMYAALDKRGFSSADCESIFGATAREVYRLDAAPSGAQEDAT
jgi:hypothetical protein